MFSSYPLYVLIMFLTFSDGPVTNKNITGTGRGNMGSSSYHLLGYLFIAAIWVVAIGGLIQIWALARPYVLPVVTLVKASFRSELGPLWTDFHKEKHAPHDAKRVSRQFGRRNQGEVLVFARSAD